MRTLEQAIIWYEKFANACRYHNLTESQEEFEQLVAWLKELQERRKAPDIIYCHECVESEQDTLFHDYWCHGKKVWRYHFCSCGRRVESENQ